jgi:polysaccharide biosynthesis protein PslG
MLSCGSFAPPVARRNQNVRTLAMKFRAILVALPFAFSFLFPADRLANNWPATWTRISTLEDFPRGLGVNIHFTDAPPSEIQMISDGGFGWIRTDLKWDATERQKGTYDFSAYDRLITDLERHSLRALFILDYGNPLYNDGAPPRTAEARGAFARWAIASAKHFGGHGILWEIYNEPNIRLFWPPRPNIGEYIALALEVGRVFRAEVPHEKLIGPATAGIDFDFLEGCFRSGLLDYWSAVSVHPYRQLGPESVAKDYSRLRKLIAAYSHRAIPIVSGEWGYSSVWRGMDEQKQSEMFAREMLTNIANGIPLSIWYDWRDDGSDATEPEHHFGLVRNTFQPAGTQPRDSKPAYLAARTINRFLDGYTFEKRLPLGSDVDYVLAFRKGDSIRYAAWTTSTPHRIFLPVANQSVQVVTNLGLGQFVRAGQNLPVELTTAPTFIVP